LVEGGLARTWAPPAERDRHADSEGDDGIALLKLEVIDAPDHLAPEAPAAVVRDRDGRVHVEYPFADRMTGRSRTEVDTVLALPGIGEGLVLALMSKCAESSPDTWSCYAVALRKCVAALGTTPYADMEPGRMPADLMLHVERAREAEAGGALRFNGREDLNRFRTLMALVPGTGHIDLRRRPNPQDVPGQWRMKDGEVETTPKLAFTDADIEKLVKRCSLEIRETVERRNQLVAFIDGDFEAAGPSSMDTLVAAKLLLEADPSRPTPCATLVTRGSLEEMVLFRIGWDHVVELAARGDGLAGEPRPDRVATLMAAVGRHRSAGRDRDRVACREWQERRGFIFHGWLQAVRVAYPTARDMCAPAATMGMLTRWNSGILAKTKVQALRPRELHWSEVEGDEDADAPAARAHAAPWKPRAKRLQPVDFPVTEDPEDPVPLTRFIQDWTAHIRTPGERYGSDLFIFVNGVPGRDGLTLSFASNDEQKLRVEFARLCQRAGTVPLYPRALRPIGIDIIHDRTNGDQMLVHGSGNWAMGSSMPGLYVAGPAQARDRERLFWAFRLLDRQRHHGIMVEQRPKGADLFAVEDGFRCGNPLDPPDPTGKGELCRSRGMCAICPHADLDLASPAWSFARLVARATYIADRLREAPSGTWARRYRPVLTELLEIWLPLFPEDVVAAARRHPAYPCPELADVDA